MIQTTGFTELCSVLSRYYLKLDGCRVDIETSGRENEVTAMQFLSKMKRNHLLVVRAK